MRQIYTFYENVPELNTFDELKLVVAWKRAWSSAGFEPIVLNLWHAEKHDWYGEFAGSVAALPSVNPKIYEFVCFARWLALAQVGGGFLCDYDVFPYKGAVELLEKFLQERLRERLTMFQERAPSLVWAHKLSAEWFCSAVMKGGFGNRPQDGKSHFSDQYFLEDLATQKDCLFIERRDVVKGFGDEGWETAPFVHYSNAACTQRSKQPKWKHIPTLRK